MVRRKNTFSKNNKNTRKKDNKQTRKKVIIACEDKNASPTYFKLIIENLITKKKITQNSLVIAKHKNTAPTGVLKDLKNTKDWNSFDKGYRWIVIDRDKQQQKGKGHELEDFNSAISQANSSDIEVAYSNDSFELWYLLHFDYICSAMTRGEINKRLIKKLKAKNEKLFSKLNSDSLKTKETTEKIFDELLLLQKTAIKNAKTLLKEYNQTNPENNNPSTTVHKLVELLNELKD